MVSVHIHRFLLVFFFISGSLSARAQSEVHLKDVICFSNGIHVYEENGKFGFKNFEKKLTEAVYDTMFPFGIRYCVVRQGNRYSIIGEGMDNRFKLPIVAAERQIENGNWKLKLTLENGTISEYVVDGYWGEPRFQYYATDPFQFYPYYSVQPYPVQQRPTDPKNFLSVINKEDYINPQVDSIRYKNNQYYYYLASGEVVAGKGEYIGDYLILYENETSESKGIMNLLSGDTILKLNGIRYPKLAKSENEIFISVYSYRDNSDTSSWDAYTLNGEYISGIVVPHRRLEYRNGVIYERIPDVKNTPYYDKGYGHYNLYRFRDGKQIAETVVEIDRSYDELKLFRSLKEKSYLVFESDSLIGTIREKKTKRFQIHSEHEFTAPENRLLSVCDCNSGEPDCTSYIFSTGTGYCKKFKGGYYVQYNDFYQKYMVYHSVYNKRKPEKSFDQFGIYMPEADSIIFFPPNESRNLVGKNVFIVEDSLLHLEDLYGNPIAHREISDYRHYSIENRQYIQLKSEGYQELYNENFELICSDCELFEMIGLTVGYGMRYFLLKMQNEPGYQIVNKDLKPVFEKYVSGALLFNNVLLIQTLENTWTYYPISILKTK